MLFKASLLAVWSGVICGMLIGCETSTRRVIATNAPVRASSAENWRGRVIRGEDAVQFIIDRTAILIAGADAAVDWQSDAGSIWLNPTRDGRPVHAAYGSCVPLTDDGYFVTAAHCITPDAPFLIIARDPSGRRYEAAGRVVWSGAEASPSIDLAIIHAAGLASVPLQWCELNELRIGAEVLLAGYGSGSVRYAAGQITGSLTSSAEAAPGRVNRLFTDAPIIPGDSGGPVVTRSGGLIGVCSAVLLGIVGSSRGDVLRPDPQWVTGLIAQDRARN